MSAPSLTTPPSAPSSARSLAGGQATCTCGSYSAAVADRAARLVRLDRAVDAGQVTRAEASERRVQLLAR